MKRGCKKILATLFLRYIAANRHLVAGGCKLKKIYLTPFKQRYINKNYNLLQVAREFFLYRVRIYYVLMMMTIIINYDMKITKVCKKRLFNCNYVYLFHI